ncbi:hypothetical protein L6164_029827 [Bauhinia variegata]|uniref:Uncharacterized protein n=2 Tax=Bauhinia variegata TaxID=167791 RepID=A0ACB9LAI4_BAUVA|nr:hypothetical protein L6164_029827 [Bauhinia variegata]
MKGEEEEAIRTQSLSESDPNQSQLPEDIHAEILKRLPVRTLARFRCVSKSWRCLFTNPIFVRTHLNLNHDRSSTTRIVLSRYFKTILSIGPEDYQFPSSVDTENGFVLAEELDSPFIQGNTYYVKGHCDGLLCLVINNGAIVLWNPSIREYRKLPTPSNFRSTREVLGLGFDSSLNDYKIIRAPSAYCKCKIKDYHPQVEVLTLSSNSWKKLPDEETPPFFIEHYQQSLTVNGGLYWLTLDDFSTVILRFDLAQEKFGLVPPPKDELGKNISWIGVLKGSLCVLHSQRSSYFNIWTTKDDQTWEKLITVQKILGPEPSLSSLDYAPLCFMKSGALMISVRGKGLVTYDPREDSYKRIEVLEDERWLQETVYTESLVSPYGSNGRSDSMQVQQKRSSGSSTNSLWQLVLGLTNGIVGHFSCYSGSCDRR